MNKDDVGKLFETMLSLPSLKDAVKIDFKLSRMGALFFADLLERGVTTMDANDKTFSLVNFMPKETLDELRTFSQECLKKAEMTEFSENLKAMNSK